MNEEEKKAIERINKILKQWQGIVDIEDKDERELEMSAYAEEMPFYEMKILLNLIEKQDKVIDKMAEEIHNNGYEIMPDICKKYKNPEKESDDCYADVWNVNACIECIKEYFMKEMESEETKDE